MPSSIERNVFVVHGRNVEARDAMFSFLRSLDLRPMEFDDAIGHTGSASPYIGEILDAAFDNAQAVVVLLTPDEIAYLRPEYASGTTDSETRPETQARPNVLFEAGMALGRHPTRTVLVELGDVRPFSDAAGRHAVRLDGSAKALQRIAQRLEDAGCPVVRSGTDWMSADGFSVPEPPGPGLPLGKKVPSERGSRRLGIDLRFHSVGNTGGRLDISNTGTEALFEVDLTLPQGISEFVLPHDDALPIRRIPAGKSARVQAFAIKGLGSREPTNFDVQVTARTEGGVEYREDVFLDVAG